MQENNGNKEKQGGLSWSTPAAPQPQTTKPVIPKVPMPSNTAAPIAQNPNSAKYIGMIVAGVVVGIVVAWGLVAWRSSGTEKNATPTTASSTTKDSLGVTIDATPALGSDPTLTLLSPQAAGMSVAVAKAIVSVPTWVVVYENKDGKPGNALGAALFFPEHQSGTVELLRSTMPGKTYLAVKQIDNGDRKFSLTNDTYLTEGGVVQWVTFETR